MIVYGDPAHETALADLVGRLRDRMSLLAGSAGASRQRGLSQELRTLDQVRALLIEAGQVEQAVADTPGLSAELSHGCEAVTSVLAEVFDTAWRSMRHAGCDVLSQPPATEGLRAARQHLHDLVVQPGIAPRVKTPEGFAFYTLYPEQYIEAASRWSAGHPDSEGSILVVGLRSIGTTLSAVVAAALAGQGRKVRRLTVRPSGHPFDRHVDISAEQVAGVRNALIVDEGPGLSGSSIVAAAAALERCGIARDRISFLPGHAHPPGAASGSDVRSWWDSTPKYVANLHQLRWAGRSLEQLIADATTDLLQGKDRCSRVENLSAGAWRSCVYGSPEDWPAVCCPFERTKYRCILESGRRVLWKSAGLQDSPDEGAAQEFRLLEVRAHAGWTPRPLAHVHGFLVTEWAEAEPLDVSDATPSVLDHIGRYVAGVAGPVLEARSFRSGRERLKEMLYWNTWELLGEAAAAQVRAWTAAMEGSELRDMPAYGDGHMAPYEWIRTPDNQLIKADSTGHVHDHTVVGEQPMLWDLAGAAVEWGLDEKSCGRVAQAAGIGPEHREFGRWYEAAYCAFRAGQCRMCTEGEYVQERSRLDRAVRRYTSRLRRLGNLDAAGVVDA